MQPTSDFDPKTAAKKLLREARSGALASLMAGSGDPYCSLVNVATAADGSPLLLISALAVHTRNLRADPRVSLMLDERREGDPLEGSRIMVNGTAVAVTDEATRARYLARHPSAARFSQFADFSYLRIEPTGLHLVAGFGRITDLIPRDFLIPLAGAEKLLEAEAGAVAHMNEDHGETLCLYAQKLCKAPAGAWRCVACDPEGLDMQCGNLAIRLTFPRRVTDPVALRKTLKELADRARAATQ